MKAKANKDFSASVNGCEFKCSAGDEIEADARTIGQLEAIGLVSTSEKTKRARKPRKAAEND